MVNHSNKTIPILSCNYIVWCTNTLQSKISSVIESELINLTHIICRCSQLKIVVAPLVSGDL